MGIFLIAGETDVVLPSLNTTQIGILIAVLLSAFIALAYGGWIIFSVRKADKGSDAMQNVAKAIQEGSDAYLNRQAKTMFIFVVIITMILGFMYWNIYAEEQNRVSLTIGISVAFFLGVLASYGAGRMGMWLAVQGNLRVAVAALKSFKGALEVAFNAGTVSGMFTIGLGLLGATVIFLIFKENAMKVLVGFGFGGCLAALFMRVGGGIFTKAADVGADLVGKVEKSIPEDDPRNAAVIADNVGDNVGDCAGMAADVFESYEVTLVAAIILGAGAYLGFVDKFGAELASSMTLGLILYPLLVRAVGVFASILGTWFVKGTEDMKDPMVPITTGFLVSAGAALAGCGVVNYIFLNFTTPGAPEWWRFFAATAAGVFLAVIILYLTNIYTHIDGTPVKETAASAKTGSATLILTGLAHGMQSSVWAILVIAACVEASLLIFNGYPALQMYGVALVGLGLLTTTGYILAMDTYGPITDNANGIFEMSGALKEGGSENKRAHEIVAKLDAIGNTTKALVKGLAIATAVIAATSLFSSFVEEAGLMPMNIGGLTKEKLEFIGIQVNQPGVFIGLLIGGAVPFLFSGMAINAVGRAASLVVEEVRRQFREIDGIMEGKNKPEYSKCVDICTTAAQKELIGPAILGIFTPILVGFAFGVTALGAFLAGSILTGQLMAVFMSNAGGIWDNGKKKIEEGFLGGKGSEAHKAGVVGDTVGDPLKDTAGPGLNPLIKVMNLVAILIAPVVIAPSTGLRIGVIAVALIALAISVWMSNKSNVTIEEKSV
ncbi:MAG TPA: sodium-translocating pyrophosphatase [Candidatus Eremiobacteraeota bacterium]|nr:sodium-translocating pyrophosphatase [Candidatus Eremiobacteraeota bacterium]